MIIWTCSKIVKSSNIIWGAKKSENVIPLFAHSIIPSYHKKKVATKRRVCQDSYVHMWEIKKSKRSIIKYPYLIQNFRWFKVTVPAGFNKVRKCQEEVFVLYFDAKRCFNKTYFGFVSESLRIFNIFLWILCFVDPASRYICVMKTNFMYYLSSVYFVNQPLNVSGIFVAHHQEVYCINKTICKYCAF